MNKEVFTSPGPMTIYVFLKNRQCLKQLVNQSRVENIDICILHKFAILQYRLRK